MNCTRDPLDSPLPLGKPIRDEKPAPAPVPTGVPGILKKPDGKLITDIAPPSRPYVAPAPAPVMPDIPIIYFVENCFVGCVGEPNGPREIHKDLWFFDGGDEDGYEHEEDAEEARAAWLESKRAAEPPAMVVDGVRYIEAPQPPDSKDRDPHCVGCAFYNSPHQVCTSNEVHAVAAFGDACWDREVIYIKAVSKEPAHA